MYFAANCIDFFFDGMFAIYNFKDEIPKNKFFLEINEPCYVCVNFCKDAETNIFSDFKLNKISTKIPASLEVKINSNDSSINFKDFNNGFKSIETDTSGKQEFTRTLFFYPRIYR